MFSGIIEKTFLIKKINHQSNKLVIQTNSSFNQSIKLGDSIAVNGICLTVESMTSNSLCFDVGVETQAITTFRFWKTHDVVNVEKALTMNGRLDGHLTYGHVNNVAKILKVQKLNNTFEITLSLLNKVLDVVYKDSICVNGVSLTVNAVYQEKIIVSVIPFTYQNTNLRFLKPNDFVNIETNFLNQSSNRKEQNQNPKITKELLIKTGFIK